MRRVISLLGVAVVLGATLVVALPTQANHTFPYCSSSLNLTTESAATFAFSGTVECIFSGPVTIDVLTLEPVVPAGPTVSGGTASCSPPCDKLVVAGTAPAAPGVYRVYMQVTGWTCSNCVLRRTHTAWFSYTTLTGQPVRLCDERGPRDALPIGGQEVPSCPY